MKVTTHWQRLLLAGAAGLATVACSDTEIDSPGATVVPPPPPTTTTPPPPPTADIALQPTTCPANTTRTTIAAGAAGSATIAVCALPADLPAGTTTIGGVGQFFALSDATFVGDGETLTILPGTTVFGSENAHALIVARGGTLNAAGTQANPIVFTSRADVELQQDGIAGNERTSTSTASQEWGGLVINGRAPINDCNSAVAGGSAGCEQSGEGSSGLYGGDQPNDNSGTLQYIRVMYAGFQITGNNELNGIAFQGVGDGTTVDHIQVHNNSDDGVEFFGGTVDVNYLVITGSEDDGIDWTSGWTGSVQFALVQNTGRGENGIEADGLENDEDATPRSNPNLSNFTFLGAPSSNADGSQGIRLRRGTGARLINGIVVNWDEHGLDVDSASTFTLAAATAGCSLNPADVDVAFGSLFFAGNGVVGGDPQIDGDDGDGDTSALAAQCNNIVTNQPSTLVDTFFPGVNETNVPAVNPTTVTSDFIGANYVGAFSPSETPTTNWAAGWTFGLFEDPNPDCPTHASITQTTQAIDGRTVCQITGPILTDLQLTRGDRLIYELINSVFVGRDVNGANPAQAVLTIDPGVTLFAGSGDALIVTRGSELRSNGTAAQPVIMTSLNDVTNNGDRTTARQEWGGLVINGRAQINDCNAAVAGGSAGCEQSGEGSSGLYGGADNTDDSGNLFYTRVQFAGFQITGSNELNGIAFQGVGNGTEVDYIQVHNNSDDGVEFFGGAVNASHVILTGNADDSVDWTSGWVGNVQYLIVHLDNTSENGIEADNLENFDNNLPRSNPSISNATFIGVTPSGNGDGSQGARLRRGTGVRIVNSIFTNFDPAGGGAFDIDSSATFDLSAASPGCNLPSTSTDVAFASLVLTNATNLDTDGDTSSGATTASILGECNQIVQGTLAQSTLSGYSFYPAASTIAQPIGVVPGAFESAPNVTAIDPSTVNAFFDASATYVGAVRDANDTWYRGWTYQDAP